MPQVWKKWDKNAIKEGGDLAGKKGTFSSRFEINSGEGEGGGRRRFLIASLRSIISLSHFATGLTVE